MNAKCIVKLPPKNKKGLEIRGLMDDLKSVVNAEEIKEGKFKVEFV